MAITTNGGAGVTADAVATLTNKTLTAPTISDATFTGQQSGLQISFGQSIVFEGTTADAFETTLTAGEPTADRVITLPNSTATLATTADIAAGQVGGVTETATQTLTNKTLTSPTITTPTITGAIFNDGSVVFEGATADAFETTLAITDPTADRTVTFQDATGTVALTSDITVTASSTTTFTNKTLTSPVIGGTTTTASGNLVLDPATKIVEVKGDGASVVGQIQLNCHVNTHGQKIASQPHSEAATNILKLPGGTTIGNSDAVLVSDIGTQTLTNKTLTAAVLKSPEERLTVSATAAATTVQYDVLTQGVLYYTSNATANWTLNVRGDVSTTLNNSLTTGDSITIVFLVTQGATAYYASALTIDGTSVTPKFITGTAFSAGNASSIDSYVYTIIKTGSAAFTVLASQTKFA